MEPATRRPGIDVRAGAGRLRWPPDLQGGSLQPGGDRSAARSHRHRADRDDGRRGLFARSGTDWGLAVGGRSRRGGARAQGRGLPLCLLTRGPPLARSWPRRARSKEGDDASWTSGAHRFLHQPALSLVQELDQLSWPALRASTAAEVVAGAGKDLHQARHQPSGHDPQALEQALLEPEHQLVGFSKKSAWGHAIAAASMPIPRSLLFSNGELDHAQLMHILRRPTIPGSAPGDTDLGGGPRADAAQGPG